MIKLKNVVGAFDGMSCGQIILNKLNISYENYFAFEIDEYAINVTQDNYPNTKQLGDITKFNFSDLPEQIDFLMGGSPCQTFSVAGDGSGFDGKSGLFWKFVELLQQKKPKFFLFENVVMKNKEWENIISWTLGVSPIKINSKKVSAQNRPRLYWTNIPNVTQPTDRNITLKDILLDKDDKRLIFDIPTQKRLDYAISRSKKGWSKKGFLNINTEKTSCVLATCYKTMKEFIYEYEPNKFRFLDCIELERLQGVPDGYTKCVSKSQRRKMIGNGWNIDTIEHIVSNLTQELIDNAKARNYENSLW